MKALSRRRINKDRGGQRAHGRKNQDRKNGSALRGLGEDEELVN